MRRIANSPVTGTTGCNGHHAAWLWAMLLMVGALSTAAKAQEEVIILVGSGSTVPLALYNRWAQEYGRGNPKIQVKYLPIGTSEGIKQISRGSGDFGAGEAQLSAKERSEASLVEIPAALIAIVPIYNLPGVQDLRLSGETLAEIFLGEVKTWNAPQIAKLNPGVSLPDLPIQVVNRPGGKGSNYVFSEFLAKASPKFREAVGVSASPKWPVGVPAERSSDMADKVKSQAGAIGYVELQYAVKSTIPYAAVQNPAGKFVKASAQSITDACQALEAPHWDGFSASLTNAPGAGSFPISSFTWIYLRTKPADHRRAAALGDFLEWIYTEGQRFAAEEGYSDLPTPFLATLRKKAKTVQ